MRRYQILIEYVGTNFVGWQIQSKGKSIQKLIQTKLSKLLKEKILLIGSGRTDSGVHAIEQSAHFECKKEIQNLHKFLKSINHFVNNMNVSIINIKKRNINFHARFSAKQRVYKYVIFNRLSRPSIEKERGWHIIKELIRTIKSIRIKSIRGKIEIQFKSQSFLQQQVRSMVGCLKYLAEKKWDLKKFNFVFKSKKRTLCAPPAPAEGLFLEKVIY